MLSDFYNYYKEREGKETFETPKGFVIYGVNCLGLDRPHLYVQDVYVKPEFRRTRTCYDMVDKVCDAARSKGCEIVVSSLSIRANGADASLRVLMNYGLKLLSCDSDTIYMFKELK